jgi:hypothetical protein
MFAGWVRWSLAVEHKTERKDFYSEFLTRFEAERERPSPELLQQMKPESIILKWRHKDKPWNGTILNVHGRENSKYPSAGRIMTTVLWTVKD